MCAEGGRIGDARNAAMTFLEISVTTCVVIGAVEFADKKVGKNSMMVESSLETIVTVAFTDMVDGWVTNRCEEGY